MNPVLQVPRENRRRLVTISRDQVAAILAHYPAKQFSDTSGFPGQKVRDQARRELFPELDPRVPWLGVGHQPELFHPGVWLKNFVCARWAKLVPGGLAFNVVVDNDLIKSFECKIPAWNPDSPEKSVWQRLRLTDQPLKRIWEKAEIAGNTLTHQEILQATASWPFSPMAREIWPNQLTPGTLWSQYFQRWRQHYERKWGVALQDITVATLSGTPSFQSFVDYWLNHAATLREVYNAALHKYRQIHRVRNQKHPLPDLLHDARGIEIPFWVVNDERSRVFFHRPQLVDEQGSILRDRSSLRPRALSLTLYLRLVLFDFFIHGLGGGLYDQITDEIIRKGFHREPPPWAVVSGTLLLPFPEKALTTLPAQDHKTSLRRLLWNPHEFLDQHPEASALIQKREEGLRMPTDSRRSRRLRYRLLEQLRHEMLSLLHEEKSLLEAQLVQEQFWQRLAKILKNREIAWIWYPEAYLRDWLLEDSET